MPSSTPCLRNMDSPSPETRDWAALPQDILFAVFLKLGPCDIMQGAELVCTTWRRVAVDYPALWRRVDMGTAPSRSAVVEHVERAAACAALARGAGRCEAFSGHVDDDLLLRLSERTGSVNPIPSPFRLPPQTCGSHLIMGIFPGAGVEGLGGASP
ncbi:hypothetical protein EJB05_52412, partial [Eragrostis curvula]